MTKLSAYWGSGPTTGIHGNSARIAFRVMWALWIGLSLVYARVYWNLAVPSGHPAQAWVLDSAFVIQGLAVGIYVSRQRFTSCAQAIIQSASTAVAVVALPATFLVVTLTEITTRLHSVYVLVYPFDLGYVATNGLQFGYVATVLLWSGIVGGTTLGILRWRTLQDGPLAALSEPSWKRYLRSAMPLIAGIVLCSWLTGVLDWYREWHPYPYLNDRLLAQVLLGIAGIFSVALWPVLSRKPEPLDKKRRILRSLKIAILSVTIVAGVVSIAGVFGIVPIAFFYFPFVFLYYFRFYLVPCLLWAASYEYSRPQRRDTRIDTRPSRRFGSNAAIACLAVSGQGAALLLGLLATAPVALGIHGIGCSTVQNASADLYWFLQAYKGLRSEVRFEKGMVLRPSSDARVCLILNDAQVAQLDEPKQITQGYVAAVYVWSWLIDPDAWESERARNIRKQLMRLLGRDFSTYDELREWGRKNSKYLAWSGTDIRLEVRQPEDEFSSERLSDSFLFAGNPIFTNIRDPYANARPPNAPATPPHFFSNEPFNVFPALPSWSYFEDFVDREARARALKLDAAACIEIVTGEQQRRVQKYLHDMVGQDFSIWTEWKAFFDQIPRPNPWQLRREDAENWANILKAQPNLFRSFQGGTGTSFSSADEFIQWLQDPKNARYDEWERAEAVFAAVGDGPDLARSRQPAIDWLKAITKERFDSAEACEQWWRENHANLELSDDGQFLVVKSK
jgi:hypothetical protein